MKHNSGSCLILQLKWLKPLKPMFSCVKAKDDSNFFLMTILFLYHSLIDWIQLGIGCADFVVP